MRGILDWTEPKCELPKDYQKHSDVYGGTVVAQLASARLSEREVPGSIFSDFNACFEFPLIRVRLRFAVGRVFTKH